MHTLVTTVVNVSFDLTSWGDENPGTGASKQHNRAAAGAPFIQMGISVQPSGCRAQGAVLNWLMAMPPQAATVVSASSPSAQGTNGASELSSLGGTTAGAPGGPFLPPRSCEGSPHVSGVS